MSKRILLGGMVLFVALSTILCMAQETDRGRAVRGYEARQGQPTPAFSRRLSDDPIDRLRRQLKDQMHLTSQALQMLEAIQREMAKETTSESSASSRRGEEGFRALYTIDRDGSNVKYLTAAPGMISSSSPEYSRDGSMVAFDGVVRHNSLGECHLFVYALEGPFQGMFKDFGCGNTPTWSPDDKQIAYMLNPGNPCDQEWGIWIMNADGSDRKRLCDGWYPRFSPDGKLLHVFAPSTDAIHVIEPDGNNERKLVGATMSVKYGGGTWSPEGNRIVFVGSRDGREHLATVAVDDDDERSVRILYTEENDDRELIGPPVWSPDGKQIVFTIQDVGGYGSSSRRWHNTYLYLISAEVPGDPVLLEAGKPGLVNRSPMWSRDGESIIFSSER